MSALYHFFKCGSVTLLVSNISPLSCELTYRQGLARQLPPLLTGHGSDRARYVEFCIQSRDVVGLALSTIQIMHYFNDVRSSHHLPRQETPNANLIWEWLRSRLAKCMAHASGDADNGWISDPSH